jgi:hypothetical protein
VEADVRAFGRHSGFAKARGISPRAPHRSGLDTLASSGSCHRTKAAAFRRELELLLLPVGSLPTAMTCPLRSTSITPASPLLRSSPPLTGASVLSASRLEPLAPSLAIAGQVLTFRTRARLSFAPPTCRMPLGQSECIPQAYPGRWVSPSRPPRRSASTCRRRCLPVPTR